MKGLIWIVACLSLGFAAGPLSAQTQFDPGRARLDFLQRGLPKIGRDAPVTVQPTGKVEVPEAEVLDRGREFCLGRAVNPDTSECEGAYRECAFGEGNAHGCDFFLVNPNHPDAPKVYLCDHDAGEIVAACGAPSDGGSRLIDADATRRNILDQARRRAVLPTDPHAVDLDPLGEEPSIPHGGRADAAEDTASLAGPEGGGGCALNPQAGGSADLFGWLFLGLALLPLKRHFWKKP